MRYVQLQFLHAYIAPICSLHLVSQWLTMLSCVIERHICIGFQEISVDDTSTLQELQPSAVSTDELCPCANSSALICIVWFQDDSWLVATAASRRFMIRRLAFHIVSVKPEICKQIAYRVWIYHCQPPSGPLSNVVSSSQIPHLH